MAYISSMILRSVFFLTVCVLIFLMISRHNHVSQTRSYAMIDQYTQTRYGIFPFVKEDFPKIVDIWRKQAANLRWKPVNILKIVSLELHK